MDEEHVLDGQAEAGSADHAGTEVHDVAAEFHEISTDVTATLGHGGETHAVVEAHADPHGGGHPPGPMDPSLPMFLWTLGTFTAMAFVLAKFAWKPILAGLEEREKDIRDSVDNADRIKEELASIDGKRSEILGAADDQAKSIVSRARRAGVEAERVIQEKAREEAAILLENARREIQTAQDKAAASLKRESVETAISLAGKLIGESLDDEKNRQLTDRLIGEL